MQSGNNFIPIILWIYTTIFNWKNKNKKGHEKCADDIFNITKSSTLLRKLQPSFFKNKRDSLRKWDTLYWSVLFEPELRKINITFNIFL